jgi:DNA processing protein
VRTHRLGEPDYPARLAREAGPPLEITISAPLVEAPVVAIVGTRHPCDESIAYARALAASVVAAGGIVASGAAFGIDTAAHEGALDAGGRTWAVAPSGSDFDVPQSNAPLYARIRASEGSAVVWPFPPDTRGRSAPFLARNRVLAALAHALVIVEAGLESGARNAASWAYKMKRPVWVVVPAPWQHPSTAAGGRKPDFAGCLKELERGAKLLADTDALFTAVGLNRDGSKTNPNGPLFARPLEEAEVRVLKALSSTPQHTDEVALRVGLDAPTVTTALLTLALEDVVVEGPGGFFRRARGV